VNRRLIATALVLFAVLASGGASSAPAAAAAAGTGRGVSAAGATGAGAAGAGATGPGAAGPGAVHAKGAELANATTGRRLWSRRANTRRPMASITKVMTALVVIRAGHLGRKIRISAADVSYVRSNDAGSAHLRAGDVLTARQLLEGMLLPSGADAAFALAKAYGPGWRAFVRKMNATARRLGMTRTHYANFDGLPWPTEHSTYSTPHDIVILGGAAMRLTAFAAIVRQRSHSIAATARHHGYHWRTTNLLLGSYPGAVGIKTGSTDAAGYCLLFEARHDGRTLVGVVLDSSATNPGARFADAARLLNWGFGVANRLLLPRLTAGVPAD
jgi:serine-type D-Ala-D-Ala carboxypeptidase (penicillin-binding protein 5/6)